MGHGGCLCWRFFQLVVGCLRSFAAMSCLRSATGVSTMLINCVHSSSDSDRLVRCDVTSMSFFLSFLSSCFLHSFIQHAILLNRWGGWCNFWCRRLFCGSGFSLVWFVSPGSARLSSSLLCDIPSFYLDAWTLPGWCLSMLNTLLALFMRTCCELNSSGEHSSRNEFMDGKLSSWLGETFWVRLIRLGELVETWVVLRVCRFAQFGWGWQL